MIKRLIEKCIAGAVRPLGYGLHPLNADQVIPAQIADPETYQGPEDYSRLHRPWLSAEYDRWITPEVSANTMLSRMKLYFLLNGMRHALRQEGDVLEAGVANGGTARLMLQILREMGQDQRTLWGLDTFRGYPRVDADRDGDHMKPEQCRCSDRETVDRLLAPMGKNYRLVEGIIPETLAAVTASRICFAHIDVNLHEPTLEATRFCLERMPPGGVIVFDDYNWPATYGARRAIDEAVKEYQQQIFSLPESTQALLFRT